MRVRLWVEPHTWEAFRLIDVEVMAGDGVAVRLGIKGRHRLEGV